MAIWKLEWDWKVGFLPNVNPSKSAVLSDDSWTSQEPEGCMDCNFWYKTGVKYWGRSYHQHTCIIMIYVELSDLDSGQPFIKSLSLQIFKNSWEYWPSNAFWKISFLYKLFANLKKLFKRVLKKLSGTYKQFLMVIRCWNLGILDLVSIGSWLGQRYAYPILWWVILKLRMKRAYPNSSNSNSHSNKEDRLMSFSKNTDERQSDEDAWP